MDSNSNNKEATKFNWYPGHIAKAERELKEKLQVIDIVIELRDARIPAASAHQDLSKWAQGKPIITVLNKSDLAAPKKEFISINSKNPASLKQLIKEIEKLSQPILDKYKSKGIIGRPTRVMVVGYPNVGKSSLINKLAQKKKAKVSDKAGVTRQQQWIDAKSKLNIKLLDTPGIIPPKFYSDDQALKLALCNCLGDNAFDHLIIAREGMGLIKEAVEEHYQLEFGNDPVQALAEKKNLKQNGELDLGRAADLFLKDFREAKIGKFCLD
ncbi:MAG: ribosome biogenesis GTPase YlqF [Candidatus Melainabacteria bacterium]|nr:ribosome biogenesis GTPase YlqF [Candidatus Melainabacteria bacterium]